jgi:uncharacterized protein (DUF885 family)
MTQSMAPSTSWLGTDQAGDARVVELARKRFDRLIERHPVLATALGIHTEDERLDDQGRGAVEQDITDDELTLAQFEAIEDASLSPEGRIERDLAIHGLKRELFDLKVHRVWERRSDVFDTIGGAIFLLLVRDYAPVDVRLRAITARLEAVPAALEEAKSRLGNDLVLLWNELELESAEFLPALFADAIEAAQSGVKDQDRDRLEIAAETAKAAIVEYSAWLKARIAGAGNDFVLGREDYDELIRLREFDGLDTDQILEIGEQLLAEMHAGRKAAAKEVDPNATEADVLDKVKSDQPPDFEAAMEAYRDAMRRARDHVISHDIATVPRQDRISVIETPGFLRNVIPFAAYFQPPKFEPDPTGIYIVTPSVDGSPRAMREHNYASISNTSVHEAYPGHHLQLLCANSHPSLIRILVDAPEFVEGWGMYSEQMMREEGFDDGPKYRFAMYTDAIWRACRIVLDVRLHRGEIGVDEAIDFLVEHTGFERPQAEAEVHRYTYTPTYQLSYLLGKTLLLRLREDEKKRLGDAFSLGRFHDQLIYAGSVPISYHRRMLREGTATKPLA